MQVVEPLLVGGYKIIQDTDFYRFTSDAVILSRFQKAARGEVVADFCAGSGIVGLHFYAENSSVSHVTFFEADEALWKMSCETIALNHLEDVFEAYHVRVQDIPVQFIEHFSLILCNPPYERREGGFENADAAKAPCRKELTLSLEELAACAKRCLKFGGKFVLIHRADRVAELLSVLRANGLEPKKLQFVAGRAHKKPYAVLVSATKGGRPGVDVLPTLVNQGEL